jgi:hypothetical protein
MPLDDVLRNPLLRKALETGEAQVGKVVGKLLADERLATGVQTLLAGAVHARETLEKGVAQALHAANLPSRDDVAALRRKLDELEAMLDGLAERVEEKDGPGGGGSSRRPS